MKKSKKTMPKEEIVIGIFYETQNGEIVYPYQWSGSDNTVGYSSFGKKSKVCHIDKTKNWKPRRDLNKFPDDPDTRLPYYFDLYWDIKWLSELKHYLDDPESQEDADEMRDEAKRCGIKL